MPMVNKWGEGSALIAIMTTANANAFLRSFFSFNNEGNRMPCILFPEVQRVCGGLE